MGDENLGFSFQPAKGAGVNNPVFVTLKRTSFRARGLGNTASASAGGIRGIYGSVSNKRKFTHFISGLSLILSREPYMS